LKLDLHLIKISFYLIILAAMPAVFTCLRDPTPPSTAAAHCISSLLSVRVNYCATRRILHELGLLVLKSFGHRMGTVGLTLTSLAFPSAFSSNSLLLGLEMTYKSQMQPTSSLGIPGMLELKDSLEIKFGVDEQLIS